MIYTVVILVVHLLVIMQIEVQIQITMDNKQNTYETHTKQGTQYLNH